MATLLNGSRVQRANFQTRCPVCGEAIRAGDEILFRKGLPARHVACSRADAPARHPAALEREQTLEALGCVVRTSPNRQPARPSLDGMTLYCEPGDTSKGRYLAVEGAVWWVGPTACFATESEEARVLFAQAYVADQVVRRIVRGS